MKKFCVYIILVFNSLSVSSALSAQNINLPNSDLIAKNLNESAMFLSSNGKYPIELVLDIKEKSIVGIKAVYDKSVTFSEAGASINQIYGEWQISNSQEPRLSLWRITPKKIAIQLSLTDSCGSEGELVQILILPFH